MKTLVRSFIFILVIFLSCKKDDKINQIHKLSTSEIKNITAFTAASGGNITSEGISTVLGRGVCWSTNANPTINDSKTIDGAGVGSFSSNLIGLKGSTTYYVKAYATNNSGTGYGMTLSFNTKEVVSDIDGNVYPILTIGTQTWMAENLKTTKYNDGGSIAFPGNDNTAWQNNTNGSYAWFNNDINTYKVTYGALYNWYAVNTGKLCPTNWHIPSDTEWYTLANFLGGQSIAGGKLKETGTTHWTYNTGATNETGFSALPAGGRLNNGTFNYFGYHGFWWNSSEVNTNSGLVWYVRYDSGDLSRSSYNKNYGFSIRCIKN